MAADELNSRGVHRPVCQRIVTASSRFIAVAQGHAAGSHATTRKEDCHRIVIRGPARRMAAACSRQNSEMVSSTDSLATTQELASVETILVVEDDPRMQKVLHRVFAAEGYEVHVAGTGTEALALFSSKSPSLVMLDLGLPQIPGKELCKRFKAIRPEPPILVLSANAEVTDKVLLLELGADDYITKPFSPRELVARAQAALRRNKKPNAPATNTTVRFGQCQIDFAKMSASRRGEQVVLTALEFKLLRYFVDNPERVISREELLTTVWGYNAYPTTRTVDNQVLKLRQRLESDPAKPVHLLTIYGAGYRFVP
jgi:DNA-binding response OmpR family regulator